MIFVGNVYLRSTYSSTKKINKLCQEEEVLMVALGDQTHCNLRKHQQIEKHN